MLRHLPGFAAAIADRGVGYIHGGFVWPVDTLGLEKVGCCRLCRWVAGAGEGPAWSWFTGTLNFLGQVTVTTGSEIHRAPGAGSAPPGGMASAAWPGVSVLTCAGSAELDSLATDCRQANGLLMRLGLTTRRGSNPPILRRKLVHLGLSSGHVPGDIALC